MGLDNGLLLHTKDLIDFPKEIANHIGRLSVDLRSPFPYEYELCYWRKCWNIRREIGYALQAQSIESVAKAWLTIEDVKNIWRAINQLNSKRAWDTSDSIWTWREMKDHLDYDLLTLEWLINFMQEHARAHSNEPLVYMVEFYDSY